MVFFSCSQSIFMSIYFPAYIFTNYWETSLKVAKTLHKDHVRKGKRVNTGRMPFSSSFVCWDVGEKLPLGNDRLGQKAELFLNAGERTWSEQLQHWKPGVQDAGWRCECPLLPDWLCQVRRCSWAEVAWVPMSVQSHTAYTRLWQLPAPPVTCQVLHPAHGTPLGF